MLSDLSVVHANGDFDGTIIHAFDGRELVLAFVTRTALDDDFDRPWSLPNQRQPTLKEHRLVVVRHLAAIEPVIQEKYHRGNYRMLDRYGSSRQLIEITHADIPRGKIELTDSVIQISRAAHFVGA
ncbi:MAG: hypothetical protein WAN51_07715 [Alphaproteobacteria bacterium]